MNRVLPFCRLFLARNPQGDGNLRGIEQLGWHGHDAVHQISVDDALADVALAAALEEREPLASTMPMRPFGARCQIMCWSQAKLALPAGGVPYCQRTSSRSLSCPQSERLKGGFARMKSALSWGWQSLKKVSALYLPRSASMPRMGQVHLRHLPGGGVGVLTEHGNPVDIAAVVLNEPGRLHEHAALPQQGS